MSKEIWTAEQLNSLIQEISNGNTDSAKQLIANYADDIHFQASLYNSDKEAVSACYQKACNVAIKNISTLDTSNPEKWFSAITASTAVSSSVITMETTDTEYDSSDEYTEKNIKLPDDISTLRKALIFAMKGMTSAERTAFTLRFYEHLNNSETAQKMQVDISQIETLLSNAKNAVAKNELTVPSVISVMNKLNPVSNDQEEIAAVEAEPSIIPVGISKKRPGIKSLHLALASVIIIAALVIFVSNRNGKSNHLPNNGNDAMVQENNENNSSDNTSNNSEDTSNSSEANNGIHFIEVEDDVTEVIGGNENSNSAQSGSTSENQQTAPDQDSSNPGSDDSTSPSQESTETGSTEEGNELSEGEVDLGDGYVTGGF